MPNRELTTVAFEPREEGAIQVELTLPVRRRRRESRNGGQPESVSNTGSRSRIPRITRLMALAIKFQEMVDRGEVRDYADLARLGYVTRARVTQIMNLSLLAPDIQEMLLSTESPSSRITERDLRLVAGAEIWQRQREIYAQKVR
jgi:hypothetical protein